jgi:hypothetical protein
LREKKLTRFCVRVFVTWFHDRCHQRCRCGLSHVATHGGLHAPSCCRVAEHIPHVAPCGNPTSGSVASGLCWALGEMHRGPRLQPPFHTVLRCTLATHMLCLPRPVSFSLGFPGVGVALVWVECHPNTHRRVCTPWCHLSTAEGQQCLHMMTGKVFAPSPASCVLFVGVHHLCFCFTTCVPQPLALHPRPTPRNPPSLPFSHHNPSPAPSVHPQHMWSRVSVCPGLHAPPHLFRTRASCAPPPCLTRAPVLTQNTPPPGR